MSGLAAKIEQYHQDLQNEIIDVRAYIDGEMHVMQKEWQSEFTDSKYEDRESRAQMSEFKLHMGDASFEGTSTNAAKIQNLEHEVRQMTSNKTDDRFAVTALISTFPEKEFLSNMPTHGSKRSCNICIFSCSSSIARGISKGLCLSNLPTHSYVIMLLRGSAKSVSITARN